MSVSILKREIINTLIPKAWNKKKKTIGNAARRLVEQGNDNVNNLLVLDTVREKYLYEVFLQTSETEISFSDFSDALYKKLVDNPYEVQDPDLKALVGDTPVFKIGRGFRNFKARLNLIFNDIDGQKGKNFFRGKQFDHGEQGSAFSAATGASLLMAAVLREREFKDKPEEAEKFALVARDAAIERLRNLDDDWKAKLKKAYGNNYESKIESLIEKVLVRWNTIADPNTYKLKANLEIAVTPAESDQGKKAFLEKEILYNILIGGIEDALEQYAVNPGFYRLRGSSTLEEKLAKIIIEQLKPRIRVKNGKVTIKVNNKIDKAVLGEITTVASQTNKANKLKKVPPVKPTKPRVRAKAGKSVLPDIRSFISIINNQLPSKVAENMGTPRLNYRTGRFANSTKAVDIQYTSKGYPSIQYTYMRYPYEVFEYPGSGSPLAQQGQRDPRDLIDKSIRDIMADFAIGRFYTRRV